MRFTPARQFVFVLSSLVTVGALVAPGCGGSGGGSGGPPPTPVPGLPSTRSGSMALSVDGQYLACANPESNSVSVFQPTTLARLAEVIVGGDPEMVAIHPSSSRVYVSNSRDATVSFWTLPNGVVTDVPVGREPMAIAMSPNGTRLYVANSASGSLSVIDTGPNTVLTTVDLTSFGEAPRAIAVTDDGDADDTDETIFVAMFFAALRSGKTSLDEGQDDQKEGRVVALSSATNLPLAAPNPIALAPLANTGFNANGRLAPGPGQVPAVASTNPQTFTTPTGVFPNQLAAIALQPGTTRAYVVSTGASPNGPIRFNSMVQGLVSVFDVPTRTELTSGQTGAGERTTAPLNLNQGVNLATTPAPRLFHSNPVAMAFRPDGSDAWIAIQNSNLVVRLTTDGSGIPSVGSPLVAGPSSIVRVDLENPPVGELPGKAPRALVMSAAGDRLFVHSFTSRSISVIDVSVPTTPVILDTAATTTPPAPASFEEDKLRGAELFYAGRGPENRMSSESWGGCVTCHPRGRSDNVTWMFDTGPRQTIALDAVFAGNPTTPRILNWSAVRDENADFELNARNVFGGRGLINSDRLFFAVGGASGGTPTDSTLIEQFQQATGVVSTTNGFLNPPFPPLNLPNLAALTGRRDFGMATLPDDTVLIVGGRTGAGQGTLVLGPVAVLLFNPHTNTVTARSSTGFTLRHSLGAQAVLTSSGVRVYAFGGYTATPDTTAPAATVQEYDPVGDVWRTVSSLPTAVAEFGSTVAGGINTAEPRQLIHVVSGNSGTEVAPVLATSVQRFQADPTGPGTWSTFVPAGLTPRRNHGAATALRGVSSRVFALGGRDAGGTVLSTVEEYTAQGVTVVVAPHTSLPAARMRFGVGHSLSTNQIYVVGGVDGAAAEQTTVFEYTIANNGPIAGPPGTPSGTWVTRANLSAAVSGLSLSSPPGVVNLLPHLSSRGEFDSARLDVWVSSGIRSSRAPVPASDAAAIAGRTLFGTVGLVIPAFSCASCHGGLRWTRSARDYGFNPPSPDVGLGLGNERVIGAELRQTAAQPSVLVNVGTFTLGGGRANELRFNAADISQAIAPLGANGFNIPSLLSVHETAPYFYNGLAVSLEQVLDGTHDANGGTRHHFVVNPTQRAELIAFLRSIDETTLTFP